MLCHWSSTSVGQPWTFSCWSSAWWQTAVVYCSILQPALVTVTQFRCTGHWPKQQAESTSDQMGFRSWLPTADHPLLSQILELISDKLCFGEASIVVMRMTTNNFALSGQRGFRQIIQNPSIHLPSTEPTKSLQGSYASILYFCRYCHKRPPESMAFIGQ